MIVSSLCPLVNTLHILKYLRHCDGGLVAVGMRGVHPNRRGASLSLFHFHPTINEFRVGRSLIKELSASGRCERLDEREGGEAINLGQTVTNFLPLS